MDAYVEGTKHGDINIRVLSILGLIVIIIEDGANIMIHDRSRLSRTHSIDPFLSFTNRGWQ